MGPKAYYKFRDTPLINKGILDAIRLRKTWNEKNNIQLVVVSPLSRALRTADIVFKNTQIPIIVLDELKEFPQSGQLINYRQDTSIMKILYPNFDFSNIIMTSDKDWNNKELPKKINIRKLNKQITQFENWIKNRPEKKIAVVGHSSYFNMMINNFIDNEESELKHCFPYLYEL
jgi:broad specificity phosphatase PhoE